MAANPFSTLLYLQLIMQIQQELGSQHQSIIMGNSEKMLLFIKHALDAAIPPPEPVKASTDSSHFGLESLKISQDEDEEEDSDSVDSDDELPGSETYSANDEMTETALNLLMALLEGNPTPFGSGETTLNLVFSSE